MFPKLSLSLIAALALSAAGGGVARADPTPTSMNEAPPKPHSPTNAEIDAAETGNPASTDYGNREIDSHSPANSEINAAEVGNPASPDYRNRPKLDTDGTVNAEWRRLDADTPANPNPDDR
jgi:hypothetical protein